MMVGPEPLTRTLRISAAGKGFAGWRADHGHPLLEQIGGIERPGAAFGMVLDRHDRKMPVPQSLHGAVVEVAVGDDDLPLRAERRFVHGVAVVLGGYAHAAPLQILHRVIAAPVPVRELERFGPRGPADDLVPEADAEDR